MDLNSFLGDSGAPPLPAPSPERAARTFRMSSLPPSLLPQTATGGSWADEVDELPTGRASSFLSTSVPARAHPSCAPTRQPLPRPASTAATASAART